MTEITFPQHGDLPDAAYWAFIAGTPATNCIITGLGMDSPDYSVPEVTVNGGKAVVNRGSMDTAHPDIDPVESLIESVSVVQVESQTIPLTDNDINHLFLQANVASDDSPQIVANTSGNNPSSASFKIGEADTVNNSISDRWYVAGHDQMLSFPNEPAAMEASNNLTHGIVYDRANSEYYKVT